MIDRKGSDLNEDVNAHDASKLLSNDYIIATNKAK